MIIVAMGLLTSAGMGSILAGVWLLYCHVPVLWSTRVNVRDQHGDAE